MVEKKVQKNNKWNLEKKICLFGYLLIPIFFVVLYFFMTETYEDIMQHNSNINQTVPEIVDGIYHYIPRIGEFYQRIATHYMTEQVSFGADMIFRLITAAFASGMVFLSAVFILGRKLKLQYKDMIISLAVLLAYMISAFSEAFTYRFSYANNYVLGILLILGVLVAFRLGFKGDKWYKVLGALLLGFVFGISSEVAPVAFLCLVALWCVVKIFKKEFIWKNIFGKYRFQTFVVIGIIAGLVFFYLGAGLGKRTSGAYAEIYDYVSPMDLLITTRATISKIWQHFWYNIRYIFFAVPLMVIYVVMELKVFKRENKYLFWQMMLMAFCVVFVGASSLIALHDDLYCRFLLPVFAAIVLASGMFVWRMFEYTKAKEKGLRISAVAMSGVSVLLIVDTCVAFGTYRVEMQPKLEAIHYNPEGALIIDPVEQYIDMQPSSVFRLKQLTPFDWGLDSSYTKFGAQDRVR